MANTSSPPSQAIQQQQTQNQTQMQALRALINASLYVGDLDKSVTDGQLYDLFSHVVPIVSVRVCRDKISRASLGYAYINFNNAQDANRAMKILNFTPLNGKPIRIMLSCRDPSIRRSGRSNVFIKNLDTSIDNNALHDIFATFGTILSCKVATNDIGQSKGYGFVHFEQEKAAQNAIKSLNGMLINDKQVHVGFFLPKQERDRENGSQKFTNLYVKNFSETTTDEDLKKVFGNYGPIKNAVIMRDANGNSRGFGFVNFQNPDDAASAVEKLNGTYFNIDKVWYVGKAQKKSEREAELKAKFEKERNGRLENLYLKNIDDSIDEEKLKELFSEFGIITSCKIMVDSQGQSKGSGFVAFSTPDEASRAVNGMNGKMIGQKPLYVAVAQRKEERKAMLQAQIAKIQAPVPSAGGGMPPVLYYPGVGVAPQQQLYFSQGAPPHGFIIPPQPQPQPAGYGSHNQQQKLLPGFWPDVAPNVIMPSPYQHLQRQGHRGQKRMGVRRIVGGTTTTPQPMQQQQQLMIPNARNGVVELSMLPQRFMVDSMMPLSVNVVPGMMPVTSIDDAQSLAPLL